MCTSAPQYAEPLAQPQEFHRFPDLPVELQTRIFKIALPEQHRVLQVLPRQHIPLTSQMPWFIFKLSPPLDLRPIRSATTISRACFASRQVYAKLLSGSLPSRSVTTPWPGSLRFDKSQTLIYIYDLPLSLRDHALENRRKDDTYDQPASDALGGQWPVDIAHLATTLARFPQEDFRIFQVLACFPRLESLVVVVEDSLALARLSGAQRLVPDEKRVERLAEIAQKLENILRSSCHQERMRGLWTTGFSTPRVYCRSPGGVYVDGDGKEYEFPGIEEIKVETQIENGGQKET